MGYVQPHMRDSFKNHRLELLSSGKITAFYMKEPNTRMMGVLIVFTPEGIAILGDLTPERHGTVSCYGYGLYWFASHLSEDYLCEKFLEKKWVPEYAAETLRDSYFRENLSAEKCEELDKIANTIDGGEVDARFLHEGLCDLELYHGDLLPGYGYAPAEAGWLCAIQQKFSELHAEYQARQSQSLFRRFVSLFYPAKIDWQRTAK